MTPGGRVEVDFSAVALKNGKKLCCKNNEELNLKLCSENTTLENQLKQLSKHFEEKVNIIHIEPIHGFSYTVRIKVA